MSNFYTCQCSRHNKDELSNSAFAPSKHNWKRNAVLFILTKVNSVIGCLSDALRNFHTRRNEMEMENIWRMRMHVSAWSHCVDEAFSTLWPHQIDGSVNVVRQPSTHQCSLPLAWNTFQPSAQMIIQSDLAALRCVQMPCRTAVVNRGLGSRLDTAPDKRGCPIRRSASHPFKVRPDMWSQVFRQ